MDEEQEMFHRTLMMAALLGMVTTLVTHVHAMDTVNKIHHINNLTSEDVFDGYDSENVEHLEQDLRLLGYPRYARDAHRIVELMEKLRVLEG